MTLADNQSFFMGPLFIIGLPRSGTKLLRGILNEHPLISIAEIETEFFPYLVKNLYKYGDLSCRQNFKLFYNDMIKLPYFIYMKERNKLIEENVWYELCTKYSSAIIFEALIRHDTNANIQTTKIWGDKSPTYINHTKFLKEKFPNAKFIHIIRDVRDYCLSINHAWGKNMIRAAQRWSDSIDKFRRDSNCFHDDVLEVKYEALISDPAIEIKKICVFINVKYLKKMIFLSKDTENIGVAKGKRDILSNNKEKYLHLMKPKMRIIIETIAGKNLVSYNYPIGVYDKTIRVSKMRMYIYQLFDIVNLINKNMRERSISSSLNFMKNYFKLGRD